MSGECISCRHMCGLFHVHLGVYQPDSLWLCKSSRYKAVQQLRRDLGIGR